jgi:hypothetical protein
MFQYLDLYDSRRIGNKVTCYYKLCDTHFSSKFTAPSQYYSNANVAVELCKIYKARNRHVAKELSRYYVHLAAMGYNVTDALDSHLQYVDSILPSIKFKELYYPLLRTVYLKKYVR